MDGINHSKVYIKRKTSYEKYLSFYKYFMSAVKLYMYKRWTIYEIAFKCYTTTFQLIVVTRVTCIVRRLWAPNKTLCYIVWKPSCGIQADCCVVAENVRSARWRNELRVTLTVTTSPPILRTHAAHLCPTTVPEQKSMIVHNNINNFLK